MTFDFISKVPLVITAILFFHGFVVRLFIHILQLSVSVGLTSQNPNINRRVVTFGGNG